MGDNDDNPDPSSAPQPPGRQPHATEQGPPLEHLRERNSAPPSTQQPMRPRRQTEPQARDNTPNPTDSAAPAETNATGQEQPDQNVVLIAVFAFVVVGSCCALGLIAGLWVFATM